MRRELTRIQTEAQASVDITVRLAKEWPDGVSRICVPTAKG